MIASPPRSPRALAEDGEDFADLFLPDDVPEEASPPHHSVFEEAEREAMRHKWIESEKAGRDLGEEALHGWARRHWPVFLRACWLEHLEGKRYWVELDRGDFGLLRRYPHDPPTLLTQVVRLLQAGEENLDVILWARDAGAPMGTVLRMLEALDVNSRRLAHRFER